MNTEHLTEDAAFTCLDRIAREYELPATDPVRFGVEPLVDAIADLYGEPSDFEDDDDLDDDDLNIEFDEEPGSGKAH